MGGKGSGGFNGFAKNPPPDRPEFLHGTGENSKFVKEALLSWNMPKVPINDVPALQQRAHEYFNHCVETDMKPTMAGVAAWMGVGVRSMQYWLEGKQGSYEHQELARKVYEVMEQLWSNYMHEGKINPVAGIYMSKVFFGYKENNEITIKTVSDNQLTADDLIAQAQLLPGTAKGIIDARGVIEVSSAEIVQLDEDGNPIEEKNPYGL